MDSGHEHKSVYQSCYCDEYSDTESKPDTKSDTDAKSVSDTKSEPDTESKSDSNCLLSVRVGYCRR